MIQEIYKNIYLNTIRLPHTPLKALNSYIITDDNHALIIDSGFNAKESYDDFLKSDNCDRRIYIMSALEEVVKIKRNYFDYYQMKSTVDIENTKGKICIMYYSFNDASKTETIKLVKNEKEIEIDEKDFKKLIKLLLKHIEK